MTKAQTELYEYAKRNDFVLIDDVRRFKSVNVLVDMGLVKKEVITEGHSVTMKVTTT